MKKNHIKNSILLAFHWALYRFWLWIAGKEDITALNGQGKAKKRHTGHNHHKQYQAYLTLAKKKKGR